MKDRNVNSNSQGFKVKSVDYEYGNNEKGNEQTEKYGMKYVVDDLRDDKCDVEMVSSYDED